MAFADTANLAVRIGLDDKLSPGLAKTTRNLGRFEKGMGRAAKGVGQVGRGLAKAGLVAGGIVATGLAAVAAAAIDFDDAFAGVKKTLNQADLDKAGLTFENLRDQIRGLATEIPVSASDIARIAEEAGALGVAAKDVVGFSKVVAELAVTTNLTTDSAAEALGKVGTILKLTGKDYEHFADVLVNLGNNGASTEAEIIEITKRFAATGKQAGLTTEEILGLSSAISSMGVEPEAAGGALSRLFANLGTNIALANDKGKAFSKLVGEPIAKLQKDVNKGRGLPLLIKLLDKIRGASKTDAYKILAGVGVTATRDRDALIKLAQGYDVLNEQLAVAKDSQGALGKEAEKRFNTVRSSLQLLKNNLIEAALVIGGDGSDPNSFIGAIGQAAKKFSSFLKDPENRRQLEDFGRGLGRAINNIDFDKLLSSAKSIARVLDPALQTLLKIAEVIGRLPPEVIGVAGGALLADRFSGGALSSGIGNIVGGLGESLAKSLVARVPLFGSAFVQPVFVTNKGFGLPGSGGGSSPGIAPAVGPAGPRELLGAGGAALIGVGVAQGLKEGGDLLGNALFGSGSQGAQLFSQWNDSARQAFGPLESIRMVLAGEVPGKFDQMISQLNQIVGNTKPQATPEQVRQSEIDFRAGERASSGGNAPASNSAIESLKDRLVTTINAQKAADAAGKERLAGRLERKADALRAKLSAAQQAMVQATQDEKRELSAQQSVANSRLAAIARKPTKFTAVTNVAVSTSVAVSELKRQARYSSRVARTTRLAAS